MQKTSIPNAIANLNFLTVCYVAKEKPNEEKWTNITKWFNRATTRHPRYHFTLEFVECDDPEFDNSLVARRFNIGSLYAYNLLVAHNVGNDFNDFINELTDIKSEDSSPIKIVEGSYNLSNFRFQISASIPPRSLPKFSHCSDSAIEKECHICDEEYFEEITITPPEEEDILEQKKQQFLDQLAKLISENITVLGKINYDEIEKVFKGKLILKEENQFITVDKNLNIVLPSYNETILKLDRIEKSFYILFLLNPDGIVMKNMVDYRDKFSEIYSLVSGKDEDEIEEKVNNIFDYTSERLSQIISKINRKITALFGINNLAEVYKIKGKRGGKYKIGVKPKNVVLPHYFTL